MSVFIIAEAGVNHDGEMEKAKKLVDAAKASGADCIKFQTFKAENIVTKSAPKADYQMKNDGSCDNQLDMLRKLELSFEEFMEIKDYCDKVGIEFLSTAFDEDSFEFIKSLRPKVWKVPSGEITNYPFLVQVAQTGQPVILSTGMAQMDEIEAALKVLADHGNPKVTILHCTTEYPAPLDEINLRTMVSLGETFDLDYGYSDHSQGIEVSLAAAALGAKVIEKHFTLDKSAQGPDHKASLDPAELTALVTGVRKIEQALGSAEKIVGQREGGNRSVARKSLVARKAIAKGEVFGQENLTTKRPGTGLSPMAWPDIMGKMAKRDYEVDEVIDENEV